MLDDKVWMLKVLVVVEYKLLEFNCSEIVSYAINVVWFAEDIDGLSEDKLDWDCEKNWAAISQRWFSWNCKIDLASSTDQSQQVKKS